MFGLPQILSSFLMIIICCFTDCAAATAIAYEKPEADVLLRRPRNARKDRLVDWKLMLQAYGFLGVIETVCSFSMSYWYVLNPVANGPTLSETHAVSWAGSRSLHQYRYAQRQGIPFSTLWFGFGNVPADIDPNKYLAVLNEASSIYFINLVVMYVMFSLAVRPSTSSDTISIGNGSTSWLPGLAGFRYCTIHHFSVAPPGTYSFSPQLSLPWSSPSFSFILRGCSRF